MDESALRTLLNSFEASRSSLHGLLHVFTWFVVVGLGFDLFVIVKEFRDDWKEFRYGQIHPYDIHLPKRPGISSVVLGLLGTALIVFGVAGELYVDVKAGKIETQIRKANDNLLSLIILEAGDAAQSAKTARGNAEAVEKEAATLMTELGKAQGKLRQLQVFALARHIGDIDALIEALKPFKGRQVVLRSYIGDAEGWLFCVSLLNAVQKAQMHAANQCGQWPFDAGKPVTGLSISGPDFSDLELIGDAIVDKGRTTGGAVLTDGRAPLLIFTGIKNPFWLPEQDLAAPLQQKNTSNPKKPWR